MTVIEDGSQDTQKEKRQDGFLSFLSPNTKKKI
jgi:hypothetical protein